jgi:tetratricopeptide (TPR) repeat protein
MSTLFDVITLHRLTSLADAKTFARGRAYFLDGAVGRLGERDGAVHADVRGTHRYHVELGVAEDGGLDYECNCPIGEDGVFCKHAVAVALSWLENNGEEVFRHDERETSKPGRKRKTYGEQIQDYLETLDAAALRALLADAMERDRGLRDRLLLEAKSANAGGLAEMKAAVHQASAVTRFLDWGEAGDYGDKLLHLAGLLEQWIQGSRAHHVVELAELAIVNAERSLEQIDDSNGEVMPAIHELADIHRRACEQTGPDAVRLAERLFRFQTEGQWDTFYDVLPGYREALGVVGVRRYRELVEATWDELPPLEDERVNRRSWDGSRMRLGHAMETLAGLDGDVDALVRIKAKDLSSPYRYLLIAETLSQHGRFDDALAWAERGLEKYRDSQDPRLLTFCVEEALRRGDHVKADAMAWQRFTLRPIASAFAELEAVARQTGSQPQARERALQNLWKMVEHEEGAGKKKRAHWEGGTLGELVSIFLAEGDIDMAWTTFSGGPVTRRLWRPMRMRALRHTRTRLSRSITGCYPSRLRRVLARLATMGHSTLFGLSGSFGWRRRQRSSR